MQEIPLTKGYVATVDDQDFEALNVFKWCALEVHRRAGVRVYAVRRDRTQGTNRKVYMHRVVAELAGLSVGRHIDHIDNNSLDNRRSNIRSCNNAENARNRPKNSNNTSGLKGVSWNKRVGKWVAQICVDYRQVGLGYFDTREEAHEAYCRAAEHMHGAFSRTI